MGIKELNDAYGKNLLVKKPVDMGRFCAPKCTLGVYNRPESRRRVTFRTENIDKFTCADGSSVATEGGIWWTGFNGKKDRQSRAVGNYMRVWVRKSRMEPWKLSRDMFSKMST